MNATDELVARNRAYADGPGPRGRGKAPPAMRLAILTCMDARIETGSLLGLKEGDAHVIRNAGANVTDDVLRSLSISQVVLGTREIAVVKHTDCGLAQVGEAALRQAIAEATGAEPPFPLGVFRDVEAAVREACREIRASELIPHKESVRGFVCDVSTGSLREVAP